MPANRNALVRYRTIDKCLQNRFRRWTLDDLIEACSDALYEYEGIEKGVSRRTVQLDIQFMRSDKLGYNAPIIVVDRKFYTYEDPDYSITNIPLTDQDLGMLDEVVEILKQFKGFTHFQEVGGMVNRLEDMVRTERTHTRRIIDFEKNEGLQGLNHLDEVYQAVLKKMVLEITYKSFKAKSAGKFHLYPYLLKEYRNRWFVLGRRSDSGTQMVTLALDRIQEIKMLPEEGFIANRDVDLENYFAEVIGVTVNSGAAVTEVHLYCDSKAAPYVLTKPLHASQKLVREEGKSVVVSIEVRHNYELEREIIGFGESMTVLKPEWLRRRIEARLSRALRHYLL